MTKTQEYRFAIGARVYLKSSRYYDKGTIAARVAADITDLVYVEFDDGTADYFHDRDLGSVGES